MALPRLIAFDFDGTLTDFLAADAESIEQVRTILAPHVAPERFLEASREAIMAFHARVADGSADPLDLHRGRLLGTCRGLGLPEPKPAHVDLYRRTLVAATRPMPGSVELLDTLAGAGIATAIVTNAYDGAEQRLRIRTAFPDVRFATVVVAGEGRFLKPHREPFDELVRRVDVAASDAWYVGDLPRHDVPGALEAGLSAIIVNEDERLRHLARELGARAVPRLDLIGPAALRGRWPASPAPARPAAPPPPGRR